MKLKNILKPLQTSLISASYYIKDFQYYCLFITKYTIQTVNWTHIWKCWSCQSNPRKKQHKIFVGIGKKFKITHGCYMHFNKFAKRGIAQVVAKILASWDKNLCNFPCIHFDPQCLPTVMIIIFTYVVRLSLLPSVLSFQNQAQQNKFFTVSWPSGSLMTPVLLRLFSSSPIFVSSAW